MGARVRVCAGEMLGTAIVHALTGFVNPPRFGK
jgi:hypothetical protein